MSACSSAEALRPCAGPTRATEYLNAELTRQVSSDGVDFEQSVPSPPPCARAVHLAARFREAAGFRLTMPIGSV
jgi:hypothetical protein